MGIRHILATIALLGLTVPASGQRADPARGPETNLPLPRYVSMKASEAYARRGPSRGHRIDWVFVRRHMPLQVTNEYGHWRRVQDAEGAGGWMHYSLLSGTRTAVVEVDDLVLRRAPGVEAPAAARLERGVVARLGDCAVGWCELEVDGVEGWAPASAIWGVDPAEAAG